MASSIIGWFTNSVNSVLEFVVPWLYKRKATLVILGLQDAGKTSLLYRLKAGQMTQAMPTLLPTCESLQHGKVTFTTYDLGGHKQARRVWRDYFPVADAILYIVDAANKDNFAESRAELQSILADAQIDDIPVAVLVNKIDIPGAVSEHQIVSHFGLYGLTTGQEVPAQDAGDQRALEVFPCSVLKEQGYGKALTWIGRQLK